MSIADLPLVEGQRSDEEVQDYLKRLANLVALMRDELEFIVNGNIDVKNIRAQSITADRMKVTELSAISANLGTITAGLLQAVTIIGSLIQTAAAGTYPRIELSSSGNLLTAEKSSASFISIDPTATPNATLGFITGLQRLLMGQGSTTFIIGANDTDLALTVTNGDLELTAASPYYVKIPSWARLYGTAESESLQTALNNKANKGITTSVETVDSLGNVNILNYTDGVLTSVT